MRPATANPQQVSSFETQQQMQARRDAEERQRQQELAAAMQQLQAAQGVPGPEADGTPADDCRAACRHLRRQPKCTAADLQRLAGQAEAKQKSLGAREAASGRTQQRHRRYRLLAIWQVQLAPAVAAQAATATAQIPAPRGWYRLADRGSGQRPRQRAGHVGTTAEVRWQNEPDGRLRLRRLSGPALSGL